MSTRPFQILLVEDSDADVYLFHKALENAGVDVQWTIIDDGAEAIAFARREAKYADSPRPDLVLLDLNLPKNNGTEVLRAIRETPYLDRVPVIIMSSSASPHDPSSLNSVWNAASSSLRTWRVFFSSAPS